MYTKLAEYNLLFLKFSIATDPRRECSNPESFILQNGKICTWSGFQRWVGQYDFYFALLMDRVRVGSSDDLRLYGEAFDEKIQLIRRYATPRVLCGEKTKTIEGLVLNNLRDAITAPIDQATIEKRSMLTPAGREGGW